jgi:hypothetical protein
MDANKKENPLSPEHDAKLRGDYPLIFTAEPLADPDDPDMPASPLTLATWGFECGDGWYELLDAPCLNLQHSTKNGCGNAGQREIRCAEFSYPRRQR